MRSLSLLTLAELSPELQTKIHALLPASPLEWQEWLKLVELNRIETQVWSKLQSKVLDWSIPREIALALENRASEIRKNNGTRRREAKKMFSELESQQIPFLILKGNAISWEIYGDLDYKQMNDFDILVKYEDLDRLAVAFQKLDLKTVAALGANFRDQEKYSHHWPLFFSSNLKLFIGTHWNLVSPFRAVKIEPEGLWQRAESFQYNETQLRRVGKEDFLIHLCVHLSRHKVGLKELADIYNVLIAWKNRIDWSQFLQLVEKSGAQYNVLRALKMCKTLVDPEVSLGIDEILTRLWNDLNSKERMILVDEVGTYQQIISCRTSHVSKIEKNYALFSLSDQPTEKAKYLGKMWQAYLWPPQSDAFRLSRRIATERWVDIVRVRARAPLEISRAFVDDLGMKIFVLVTLGHHFELLSSFNRRLRRRPVENLLAKAAKLGLTKESLQNLASLE